MIAAATAVIGAVLALRVDADAASALPTLDGAPPLVIAHRGASGYLPEHTLAGYELAVRMGADFIEPDLQLTRDGEMVAMHDDTLNRTTDAEAVLEPRHGGWRVRDFDLAEIERLTVRPTGTARAGYPGFTPRSGDAFRVPTFDQVITLAQSLGPHVGLYPEAKAADALMEDRILATLRAHGYGQRGDKVFIQSFDLDTLKSLRRKQQAQGMAIREVLLGNPAPGDFAALASTVDGIGPSISAKAAHVVDAAYVRAAHDAGLLVHGYTFALPDAAAAADQYGKYFGIGVDGVFSNYPDLAVAARRAMTGAAR